MYAGGKWTTNNQYAYYYLNASGGSSTGSNYWWTMSPYNFNSSYGARVFRVYGSGGYPGYMDGYNVTSSHVVRPVVSLKSSAVVAGGTGSASDPYVISLP